MANRHTIAKKSTHRYMDTLLILILMLIIIFGLVMLYSVSSYDGGVTYGDTAYYFKKQLINTIFGLIVMVIVSLIPYKVFLRFHVVIYAFAVIFLLLIIPFGTSVNGAKRWIHVAGISIQPAEIAKLAIIIVLAYVLVRIGNYIDTWKGFIYAMAPSIPLVLMIYGITRNLSSAIIVAGIAFTMCFVVSKDYKRFALMLLVGVAFVALVVFVIVKNSEGSLGFRGERVLAWLDPTAYASGKGYQTVQALYAIGSGGVMGKGLGQSMQKLGYIPEAQNDMIFAIICEELGFVGAVCIIGMFLILIWRCIMIAINVKDMAGSLLVTGFAAHISIQVILNIAVVTNTIPNTGISLPFISYGGSSVVSLLAEVGLVLSVQRSIIVRE